MTQVTINGKEYPVKFGHLAYSYYMQDGRKLTEAAQGDNMYYLHYAALKAGAKRAGTEMDMTYDQFMIALDDNEGVFQKLLDIQAEDTPKK